MVMSPDFKASVDRLYCAILEKEFGLQGGTPSPRASDLIGGIMYRFVQRLTREACSVADTKGKFDAECFTFACRKNLRMFRRLCTLRKAKDSVSDVVSGRVISR